MQCHVPQVVKGSHSHHCTLNDFIEQTVSKNGKCDKLIPTLARTATTDTQGLNAQTGYWFAS